MIVLAIPVSCVPATSDEPVKLIAALEEDVRGSDPQRELYGLADAVHLHVVEGLVGLKNDLSVGLMLAESLDVTDGGRTYKFTLRDHVRFHNGAILDASHVVWSWNYLMAPSSLWRCRSLFAGEVNRLKVVSVRAPERRAVVYRLSEPHGGFLNSLARLDCAQTPVLHPSSLTEDGQWRKPVGTGPFKFKRRRIGEFIELEKFKRYTSRLEPMNGMVGGKQPLVEEIRFLVIGDPTVRMLGLQAGDIHIAPVPAQYVVAAIRSKRLDLTTSPTTVWSALLLNTDDPLLRDRRVRKAIEAAIDRTAVARAVTYGQAQGSVSPIPPGTQYAPGYPSTELRADPERARQLLAEAGYAGEPLVITTNRRFSIMFDAAVVIENMLSAVGFNTRIDVIEWSLQLSRYNSDDYQALSFAYSGRFSPGGMWGRFIGPEPNRPWRNERAIALVRKVQSAMSPRSVREALDELQTLFIDEVPAVSLFHPNRNVATNKRVSGFEGSYFEAMRLWNVSLDNNASDPR